MDTQETFDALEHRANVLYVKGQNNLDACGKALAELKLRVTTTEEGDPWKGSWAQYCRTGKLKIGYQHANRLISHHLNPDKAAAYKVAHGVRSRERSQLVREGVMARGARHNTHPARAILDEVADIQDDHEAQVRKGVSRLWSAWRSVSEEAQNEFLRQLGYAA